MNTTGRWLFVAIIISGLTVYGCAQQDSRSSSSRIRALETRNTKLENDYKVVARTNESYRTKLTQLEQNLAEIAQQMLTLESAARERDELRVQVNDKTTQINGLRSQLNQVQAQLMQRTGERDVLKTQLTELSSELQGLAGRIETALHGGTLRPSNASLVIDIEQ